MILLDTHALIWFLQRPEAFGIIAKRQLQDNFATGQLSVSVISYWEIGLLVHKGRLGLDVSPIRFREMAIERGISECPLDGRVALEAAALDLHPDPADRFIVATALAHTATLVTADEKILGWAGPLLRQDARL